jgi:putative transposase
MPNGPAGTHGTRVITYLWTGEGWLYLAVALDLFSRRSVGWSRQTHLNHSLVVNPLEAALYQRSSEAGLLHHNDRTQRVPGQNASGEFQSLLDEHEMISRMS